MRIEEMQRVLKSVYRVEGVLVRGYEIVEQNSGEDGDWVWECVCEAYWKGRFSAINCAEIELVSTYANEEE